MEEVSPGARIASCEADSAVAARSCGSKVKWEEAEACREKHIERRSVTSALDFFFFAVARV
jgi:hypothetical protein